MIQLFLLIFQMFWRKWNHTYMEVSGMRRRKRRTFEELVLENKKELLSNEEFLNQLEEKLEERFRQK